MLRVLVRRSRDVDYFTLDAARELDGLRDGGPGWWLRGDGDTRDASVVERVLTGAPRSNVDGYDIVIAAPRPISVLLAVDPDHGAGVVAAHRHSVRASIEYLERHALIVRDRRGGHDLDRGGSWERIVGFTHGLNRHGEPHLHDHVLVGARPSGATSVLDSRCLYAHARAADALYRGSLRRQLAVRTPWRAWRSFDGVEHVAGLDEGYRALWSGHHATRGDKLHWSRRTTLAAWNADVRRFDVAGVVDSPREVRVVDEHRFAGAFEGRDVVARRHVIDAWANAVVFGQDASDTARCVDAMYPALGDGRGVREATIGVRDARLVALVRERGPRPVDADELDRWRRGARSVSRSVIDHSR